MDHRRGLGVSSVALKGDTILTIYTRGSLVVTRESFTGSWFKEHGTFGEKGKAILSLRWTLDGMRKPPLGIPSVMTLIGKINADGYVDNERHLINPEHLNEGSDFFHQDEILAYDRVAWNGTTSGLVGVVLWLWIRKVIQCGCRVRVLSTDPKTTAAPGRRWARSRGTGLGYFWSLARWDFAY